MSSERYHTAEVEEQRVTFRPRTVPRQDPAGDTDVEPAGSPAVDIRQGLQPGSSGFAPLPVRGDGAMRAHLLLQLQQTHGNHFVQRLLQRQRAEQQGGPVAIQRDTPVPPAATVTVPPTTNQPAGGTAQPAPKDPQTDAPAAWALMQAFADGELKKQLGQIYTETTANLFYTDWVPYFGTADRVTAYFGAIRKAAVPGDVHLHEAAAARLEMVKARLGEGNMPSSGTALGLVRGRPKVVKNLLQHHLGLAIDFRAVANPHITDPRLKTLMRLQTGEDKAHYMDLGDYVTRRALLKKLGQASVAAHDTAEQQELAKEKLTGAAQLSDEAKARIAAAATDPESPLGKQGAAFYDKIKSEHERVADASKKFRTNLPPAVQSYLDLRRQQREAQSTKQQVEKNLRGLQPKITKAQRALDAGGKELERLNKQLQGLPENASTSRIAALQARIDNATKTVEDSERQKDDLAKQQTDLEKQNADLTQQEADRKKSIGEKEADMPALFKDWIDKIDKEQEKLQKAAGNVDLSTLPSRADLAKQQELLAKQEKETAAAKKKAEKDIAGLQAKVAKAQKAIDASGKELDTLNKQLSGLPADAPELKRAALQKKIDKANKTKEDNEKQIGSVNDQISAIQGVSQQPGQGAAQAKPTLAQANQKLAELEKQLKDVKARMDLLPKKEELDKLEDLKKGLKGERGLAKYDKAWADAHKGEARQQGKDFAFKGQSNVSDPSIVQLLEKGYMNPDEDYAPGEKPDSDKHGFNEQFFKTMAEFGFDLGGAWESPDAMHFELVEGLDLVTTAGAAAPAGQSATAGPTGAATTTTTTTTTGATTAPTAAQPAQSTPPGVQ